MILDTSPRDSESRDDSYPYKERHGTSVIEEASRLVVSRAQPMDNADLDPHWRKDVRAQFATYALRELRGDDLREIRLR